MSHDEKVGKILRSYRTKANICRGSIAYNIVEDQAVSQLNALDKIDEKKLREYLWLSHGHYGLYGDDGEMQCGICRLDFKRDSLDKIINRVVQVREKENIDKLFKQHTLDNLKIDKGKLQDKIADGMFGCAYYALKSKEKQYINDTVQILIEKAEEWMK